MMDGFKVDFLAAKDMHLTWLMNYERNRSPGRQRRARKVRQRDSVPLLGRRVRVAAGPL